MDDKLFKAINQLAGSNRLFDYLMVSVSQKMRYVFLLIFIFLWFHNKVYRKAVYITGLGSMLTILAGLLIKPFYYKPRPFVRRMVRLLPPVPPRESSSFPSKHTALAFMAATSIIFYNRLLGSVMYVLSLLTGLSSIWMGQHDPSDIAGSAFLGSFMSLFARLAGMKMIK